MVPRVRCRRFPKRVVEKYLARFAVFDEYREGPARLMRVSDLRVVLDEVRMM